MQCMAITTCSVWTLVTWCMAELGATSNHQYHLLGIHYMYWQMLWSLRLLLTTDSVVHVQLYIWRPPWTTQLTTVTLTPWTVRWLCSQRTWWPSPPPVPSHSLPAAGPGPWSTGGGRGGGVTDESLHSTTATSFYYPYTQYRKQLRSRNRVLKYNT